MFSFASASVSTDLGQRHVGVMTPRGNNLVKLEDIERLSQVSGVDAEVLDFADTMEPSPSLWILRGRGEQETDHWRLDPEAGEARIEIARALLSAHLPTYSSLYERGVAVILHLDLHPEDVDFFQRAARKLGANRRGMERHLLVFASQFASIKYSGFANSSFARHYSAYARKAQRLTGTFDAIQS